MTDKTITIRTLSFIGGDKEPATIKLNSGFNLIYGPSNTGKSSILDALYYMLSGTGKLKHIPEHEGYSLIALGLEFSQQEAITLFRNLNGGDYEYCEGIHTQKPEHLEMHPLKAKKATKSIPLTLSSLLLGKVGLADKKLKKNSHNKTVSLTLGNLLPIAIINETDIPKETSPYISVQRTDQTLGKSRLKFLLEGTDDSLLINTEENEKATLSLNAKLALLDEIISNKESTISASNENSSLTTLEDQQEKLNQALQRKSSTLEASENEYHKFTLQRNSLRIELEKSQEREAEVNSMLTRFNLLDRQYSSDVDRLNNISEAGTLLLGLPDKKCTACGYTLEKNTYTKTGNTHKELIEATKQEKSGILTLQKELSETVEQLKSELNTLHSQAPEIERNIEKTNKTLKELSPTLNAQRASYTQLISKQKDIEKTIDTLNFIEELEKKKEELEEGNPTAQKTSVILPTNSLYKLSKTIDSMLKEWELPNYEDIQFDEEKCDFIINGKHRESNGKGYRAITHAAATLGLMKYIETKKLPHLGFTIIDSPLLAYEEPENDEDDLSNTELNLHLFNYLQEWKTRQTIIIENNKSIPSSHKAGKHVIHFTQNHNKGRYGFFPVSNDASILGDDIE